ncbi:SDR family oxidoreductase [Rhizobium sp. FKL33]|uniref:SDR family oxidoreductase n=1 Tax=Rhizobium sp. FKL33 TaxID=2562307 RepID=UPI0010BFE58C|nr:SDR family oxidoreductase [Rhizobium sp. FKL33]
MKILILGATGFIGSAITDALATRSHQILALGRNTRRAEAREAQLNRDVSWLTSDLSGFRQASDWTRLLDGVEVVVNCAGALQDGLSDNLAATQRDAMLALYNAAARTQKIRRIVQISADTDGAGADAAFLATKRAADDALKASGLDHVILRPALVIGRNAFGGTALIRALAALPFVLPLIDHDSPVATVALSDVAAEVVAAVEGETQAGADLHLASPEIPTLAELVKLHRRWLGLPDAPVIALPALVGRPVGAVADLLGRLGWRSPLRSTALRVMSGGLTARSPVEGLLNAGQTLAAHPAGVQDLWFARLYFKKPLLFFTLSLFWLLSGLIPLLDPMRAGANFLPFMPWSAALGVTLATCALDIALGLAVAVRPWSRRALWGMLATSLAYIVGGTLLQPDLWLDPLGPLVKVTPSLALTLVALAILDER